jgi:starch synthase (maltosyl-transferring)
MPPRRSTTASEVAALAYLDLPGATTGRYAVEDVEPILALGLRGAKTSVDEAIVVSATIVGEGHDLVGADVVLTGPDGVIHGVTRMAKEAAYSDRWSGVVRPDLEGRWTFQVQAWGNPVATWLHRAEVKIPAGQDVELELEEGARLLERALRGLPQGKIRTPLKTAIDVLRDQAVPAVVRLAAVVAPPLLTALEVHPLRVGVSASAAYPLRVESQRALYSSWYEFFPRSEGATLDPPRSGTFTTAAERLPAVAAMGFDVLYLPPIHPIGTTFRKGPNNTLDPGPDDPGSPWAIGSAAGGHDAIHPDLGTVEDFRTFVQRANELGLQIALDLALQCSPDHPWVTQHPEWFIQRADGSVAYAENPPKKYQDIYPVYFDADPDGLHVEVMRIVRHWIALGVRIFRVDNPHTKPVAFWERLITEVNTTDPDVIFLAEAFTRPAMMKLLGEVGFQQSYTYFTWRNQKWELEEYVRELAGPTAASMRPNFFVNTPDILSSYLQYGGPAAFAIRATLAATLSPAWGVYAGFELYEHAAVRPGSEEYLDSEKYQYRPRDWKSADSSGQTLAPYLTELNQWRREHVALQRLRNLHVHTTDSEHIIAYSKREGDDVVLVVCTLDPRGTREGTVSLDLKALGLSYGSQFVVHDLVTGSEFLWGEANFVRLDPYSAVAHVLVIRPGGAM